MMSPVISLHSGRVLFWKSCRFITHVSGDFPSGPICVVQPNAARVQNRLMAYSPERWAASGTYMKHAGGAEPQTRRRSACCRTEQSQRHSHSLAESGGKSVRDLFIYKFSVAVINPCLSHSVLFEENRILKWGSVVKNIWFLSRQLPAVVSRPRNLWPIRQRAC